MGLRKQIVEIGERAEARIDATRVGDVVAEIGHRRGVDGRDPDRVDAEVSQIVEPPLDPLEVAYAVAVRVLKGAWVDLVDHGPLPPEHGHANRALGMWVMRQACAPRLAAMYAVKFVRWGPPCAEVENRRCGVHRIPG